MAGKLPSDFDPKRYSESYPDVALSGLTPQEHYLRFGTRLRRSPTGIARSRTAPTPKPNAAASSEILAEPQTKPQASAKPSPSAAIIQRPADLDTAKLVPSPAPPKANCSSDEPLSIEALSAGPFRSSEEGNRICIPLLAYDAMISPNAQRIARESDICGASNFQHGSTRIENAWFPDAGTLRLMLTGGDADEVETAGWSLRAYQADPAATAQLRMAGAGVQLPPLGPVFYDIALLHPFMPLLLELSDSEGSVRGLALLPFPSLLAGGFHAAELKVLQPDFNPMDAFWTVSETLLWELVGQPGSPDRSIVEISTSAEDGSGALTPEIQQWLLAVFGLSLSTAARKQTSSGLRLVLPPDSIPAIRALVSRSIAAAGEGERVGPFLVSEPSTFRPRWSVSLPQDIRPEPNLPVVMRVGRKSRRAIDAESRPLHLSIALREPELTVIKPRKKSGAVADVNPGRLTVVIEASEPALTESLVTVLSELAEGGTEFLVRFPESNTDIADVLDRCCGASNWTPAHVADLRELARKARHETLLTVSDRVRFDDPQVVVGLCDLLHSDSRIGSASCMLLAEAIVKKRAVVQPASGGLFPARVSFAASPRLAFYEPDVRDALPDLTYPVAANTLLLTAWRGGVLGALRDPDRSAPSAAADIRLGLDLLEAGYQNLCTSRFSATIQGPYTRRDAIDPVGAAYAEPQRWADVLTRVALVQELF
jgi:hypothetical protein